MLDKQGYMQTHVCTRVRFRHTHTEIYNIYCFSTAPILCKRASILRYMYIACLAIFELSSFVSIPCLSDGAATSFITIIIIIITYHLYAVYLHICT